MKMKLLPLFFIVLIVVSVAQPIFAYNSWKIDTKIVGADDEPLKDITVSAGNPIALQAKLVWCGTYDNWKYYDKEAFLFFCYLNFYVYKSNADGSNGDIVWSGSAIAFNRDNANLNKFSLNENGTYNLLVEYEGYSDVFRPCNATAKIYVV